MPRMMIMDGGLWFSGSCRGLFVAWRDPHNHLRWSYLYCDGSAVDVHLDPDNLSIGSIKLKVKEVL